MDFADTEDASRRKARNDAGMGPPPPTPGGDVPGRHSLAALDLLVDVLVQSDHDLIGDEFYSRLAEAVCRGASMSRAVVFAYDDARRRVRAVGGHGIDTAVFSDAALSVESAAAAGQALAEDRVVEVDDTTVNEVAPEFRPLLPGGPLVWIPIAAAGRWIGVILAEPEAGTYPLDDGRKDLLWSLGKTLALASMSRVATHQAERATQLEERIDLAREIHERVVQRLFGLSLALSSTQPLDGELRERCTSEVQAALADLRSAIQRPLGRPPRRTEATLCEELERLQARHPDLGIEVDGEVPQLPRSVEPVVQSVLAEAIRNARKHADTQRVVVRVRRNDAIVLEVENDGARAFRGPGAGMGLRLAAMEALQAGGVVEFGEREAGIWQVRLVVPMPERDDD